MEKFKDNKLLHIESDIEKIQTSLHMYISYSGSKGAFHISKEGINNAIDECINPNSPGNEVNIYLDETKNEVIVTDNGRGIPHDDLVTACTTLQSSSKFTREGSGASAGQNGVGITAQNAVSKEFELTSLRYGEKASVQFSNGKVVEPFNVKKVNNKGHGTTVRFIPSELYLGNDCQIRSEDMIEWLDDISCLVPPHIKMNLTITRRGKEALVQKKYRNKDGLYTIAKRLSEKPILEPIHFIKSTKVKETIKERSEDGNITHKEVERFLGLEVAFTYNSGSIHSSDIKVKSFCNFVSTIEHGVHVDATRQGILNYFSKQAREALNEKEAKKIEIIPADVLSGLSMAVYVQSDLSPEFTGQTKEKMSNPAYFRPVREMTYSALVEYFRANPKELKRITDHIKTNAKARIEANKVRTAVIRGETTNLDMHRMKWFVPANNKGKGQYRELFIVEGESAQGSCSEGRFEDFQAVFAVRGYVLNTVGVDIHKIIDGNDELKSLIKVLKTNVGRAFDINKCDYVKIIIMTDGDADGFFIFSLLCAFFATHLPKLVEAGMIYKAVPPLYEINDSKNPYTTSRAEFIKRFETRIGDNIRLSDPVSRVVLKGEALRKMLMDNRDYLETLQRVSGFYGINDNLMEFIAIHYKDSKFGAKLNKMFPEVTIDKDLVISGIIDGSFQNIKVDDFLVKRITPLVDLIHTINAGNAYYFVEEKVGGKYEDRGIMSIGNFMKSVSKYRPKIINRFKGLGELTPDKLRKTTLDPNHRTLIRLTTNDIQEELNKFNVLHGNAAEERKRLIQNFKVPIEDLDN